MSTTTYGDVLGVSPITSIEEWMAGVGHGAAQHTLYEALCMEEMGDTLQEFVVTDGDTVSQIHGEVGEAMKGFSRVLRENSDYMRVVIVDRNKLIDAHLDSAWVHLCAAAAVLGDVSKLREAWSRLHNANVVDKQVDGEFVLDQSGKVLKPHTWTPPDYTDLITTKEIL